MCWDVEASSEDETNIVCVKVKEYFIEVVTKEGVEETSGGSGCVSFNEGEAKKPWPYKMS